MRKNMPDAPRGFKTPFVPVVPILGIITCLFMMVFLPLDTWIRLIVWMIIGFDVYLWYGIRHSFLSAGQPKTLSQANKIGGGGGLALSILLALVAFTQHLQKGTVEMGMVVNNNQGIFYFSLIFAALHVFVFSMRLARK
jgi:APA family basic amino acid/polyamine antiporter